MANSEDINRDVSHHLLRTAATEATPLVLQPAIMGHVNMVRSRATSVLLDKREAPLPQTQLEIIPSISLISERDTVQSLPPPKPFGKLLSQPPPAPGTIQRIIDNNGDVFATVDATGTLFVHGDQPGCLCELPCCLIPCWCDGTWIGALLDVCGCHLWCKRTNE